MKKIIAILLSVFMLAALCACGGDSSAGNSTPPSGSPSDAPEGETVWPAGDVQISVPYKAGGGVDSIARLVCAALEKSTGETFVITNRPEGNGIIAINELMHQEPDGYNLMVVSNRDLFGHIVNQIEGVEYDKDSFTYLATLLEGADCLFTQSDKYSSFDELIEHAEANPGAVTIATSNNTGLQTLEQISGLLGIEVSGVAYSSGTDAFADLMGGHVDAAMVALSFFAQGRDAGIIPVLTMSEEKFPVDDLDVPCLSDYGLEEAASPMLRFLLGPAGMDQSLVDAIVAQLDVVYADDSELVAQIKAQYDNPNYLTGAELAQFVEDNFALRMEQAG